jgi:hypothetical protein
VLKPDIAQVQFYLSKSVGSEKTVRIVTDNCRTLKFDSHSFEREQRGTRGRERAEDSVTTGLRFVCPLPVVWNDIYKRLHAAWVSGGSCGDPPPVPLILNGWVFTSDMDKKCRWDATLAWARGHSLVLLIPQLGKAQRHEVTKMTTSIQLSWCSGSYRLMWECREAPSPGSVLCPECGAVVQPDIDQYQGGDEEGMYFATIPGHDRAE